MVIVIANCRSRAGAWAHGPETTFLPTKSSTDKIVRSDNNRKSGNHQVLVKSKW
jgi:hypothetical protein